MASAGAGSLDPPVACSYFFGNTPPDCAPPHFARDIALVRALYLGCGDLRNAFAFLASSSAATYELEMVDRDIGVIARNLLLLRYLRDVAAPSLNAAEVAVMWELWFCASLSSDVAATLRAVVHKLVAELEIDSDWILAVVPAAEHRIAVEQKVREWQVVLANDPICAAAEAEQARINKIKFDLSRRPMSIAPHLPTLARTGEDSAFMRAYAMWIGSVVADIIVPGTPGESKLAKRAKDKWHGKCLKECMHYASTGRTGGVGGAIINPTMFLSSSTCSHTYMGDYHANPYMAFFPLQKEADMHSFNTCMGERDASRVLETFARGMLAGLCAAYIARREVVSLRLVYDDAKTVCTNRVAAGGVFDYIHASNFPDYADDRCKLPYAAAEIVTLKGLLGLCKQLLPRGSLGVMQTCSLAFNPTMASHPDVWLAERCKVRHVCQLAETWGVIPYDIRTAAPPLLAGIAGHHLRVSWALSQHACHAACSSSPSLLDARVHSCSSCKAVLYCSKACEKKCRQYHLPVCVRTHASPARVLTEGESKASTTPVVHGGAGDVHA